MQQAADEAMEVTRLVTDGLKVSKQQPPLMMAKGTPPLKQIPGYTLWPSAKSLCTVGKHVPAANFRFLDSTFSYRLCELRIYRRFGRHMHH
jgi:hypothetical protein